MKVGKSPRLEIFKKAVDVALSWHGLEWSQVWVDGWTWRSFCLSNLYDSVIIETGDQNVLLEFQNSNCVLFCFSFAAGPCSLCYEGIFCKESALLDLFTIIWRASILLSAIPGWGVDHPFSQWEIEGNFSPSSRVLIYKYLLTLLFGLSEADEWLSGDLYHVLGNADWKQWISNYIEHV